MDGFELNKIMGAVLATCLFVLSVNIVSGAIFAPQMPEKPGLCGRSPGGG
jgi:cytochrome c